MNKTFPAAYAKSDPLPSSNMCISVIDFEFKLNFITSFSGLLKFKELVASMNILRIFDGELNLGKFNISIKCAQ